ncbi:MAG: PAS domain-containing protein [Spirochaetales bacterium]|nr:PAS domain-containing protein [Spirochaetales bacterium]MCF7937874.1 PAS domain-containing protein [Spirochaetales bacterium]
MMVPDDIPLLLVTFLGIFVFILFLFLVFYQIYRRRESERASLEQQELLFDLLDYLGEGFFLKDTEFRFLLGNRTTAELHGFPSREEITGKTDFDMHEAEPAQRFYEEEQELLKTGKAIANRIVELNGADGPRFLRYTKIPRKDSEGKIIGIAGVIEDVTDRILREKENEKYRRKMEEFVQAKTQTERLNMPDEKTASPAEFGRHRVDSLVEEAARLLRERMSLKAGREQKEIKIRFFSPDDVLSLWCDRGAMVQLLVDVFKSSVQALQNRNIQWNQIDPQIIVRCSRYESNTEIQVTANGAKNSFVIRSIR